MKCFRQCVSLHNYSGVEEIASLYIVAAKSLETFLTAFPQHFYYTFIPLQPYFFSKICKILKLRFSIKYLHKNTQLLFFFVF